MKSCFFFTKYIFPGNSLQGHETVTPLERNMPGPQAGACDVNAAPMRETWGPLKEGCHRCTVGAEKCTAQDPQRATTRQEVGFRNNNYS